jgi:cytosine/adenosine deaminase-related metal-dependent hydrolase
MDALVSIEPERPSTYTVEVIDLEEYLVLPGFIDGHIHLDKSLSAIGGIRTSLSRAYANVWRWKNESWRWHRPSPSERMH